MELTTLLILLYITAAFLFSLTMFLIIGPWFTMKRIMKLFTSTKPKDIALVNAMGFAMADRAIGLIQGLGEEFKKGNTAPLVRTVAPIFDAVHHVIESAKNGAKGNLVAGVQKGAMAEYAQIRETIPKAYRKYSDTVATIAHFMENWKGKSPPSGGRESTASTTTYVKV